MAIKNEKNCELRDTEKNISKIFVLLPMLIFKKSRYSRALFNKNINVVREMKISEN